MAKSTKKAEPKTKTRKIYPSEKLSRRIRDGEPERIGWGIDQAKYDKARKPKS